MEELINAELFFDDTFIIALDHPKLKRKKGVITIECFLNKDLLYFSNHDFYFKNHPDLVLHDNIFKIRAKTRQNSTIEFFEIFITRTSYPSFQFIFTCFNHSMEYANVYESDLINNSVLSSIIVEGWKLEYNKTSEIVRYRSLFGIEDSRMLSIEVDNLEVSLNLWFKKRYTDLKIGLIKHPKNPDSVIVKFYNDSKISYRIYNKIKDSIKHFISFLAGNNIVIREENYSNEKHGYFIKFFSELKIKKITNNEYLPVNEVLFKHKNIVQDYFETISVFLFLDKKIKISEIIYLINQSKKVDIESAFFILLICIEKLSRLLLGSDLISESEKVIIPQDNFNQIKEKLFENLISLLPQNISKSQKSGLKAKIYNLNSKGKTDYKIDQLLTYTEIERTENINALFPQLRNLAIHEGEISNTNNGHYENYLSLFNLVNEIICNLIQYKGIRRPLATPSRRNLYKKETFLWDYKKNVGYVNGQ